MKVYAFDFDGTLTRRDSFVEFIRFVKGDKEFLKCFLRYSLQLVAMKLGLYPNWKVKRQVCSRRPPSCVLQDWRRYAAY